MCEATQVVEFSHMLATRTCCWPTSGMQALCFATVPWLDFSGGVCSDSLE